MPVDGHILFAGVGCSMATESFFEGPACLSYVQILGGAESAFQQVNNRGGITICGGWSPE